MKPVHACTLALLALAAAPIPRAEAQPQPPPLVFAQPLVPGAVREVQERLRQQGFYTGRVDGLWGPDSVAALERYQHSRGVQVTGTINQATAMMLGLAPAELLAGVPGVAAPPVVADPLSPPVVRGVQQRLRALGFYRGGADGIWGPATQTALERFQASRGLQATGQLNPTTAQALGLDPVSLLIPAR
ncbi:MAG TPA: peptidoglycan-binding domain-containing protein [Acetobacteraceae bacterium]|nr:peptidoglycan-binding domain-containing protein [Acetobacteraceae bacterium]